MPPKVNKGKSSDNGISSAASTTEVDNAERTTNFLLEDSLETQENKSVFKCFNAQFTSYEKLRRMQRGEDSVWEDCDEEEELISKQVRRIRSGISSSENSSTWSSNDDFNITANKPSRSQAYHSNIPQLGDIVCIPPFHNVQGIVVGYRKKKDKVVQGSSGATEGVEKGSSVETGSESEISTSISYMGVDDSDDSEIDIRGRDYVNVAIFGSHMEESCFSKQVVRVNPSHIIPVEKTIFGTVTDGKKKGQILSDHWNAVVTSSWDQSAMMTRGMMCRQNLMPFPELAYLFHRRCYHQCLDNDSKSNKYLMIHIFSKMLPKKVFYSGNGYTVSPYHYYPAPKPVCEAVLYPIVTKVLEISERLKHKDDKEEIKRNSQLSTGDFDREKATEDIYTLLGAIGVVLRSYYQHLSLLSAEPSDINMINTSDVSNNCELLERVQIVLNQSSNAESDTYTDVTSQSSSDLSSQETDGYFPVCARGVDGRDMILYRQMEYIRDLNDGNIDFDDCGGKKGNNDSHDDQIPDFLGSSSCIEGNHGRCKRGKVKSRIPQLLPTVEAAVKEVQLSTATVNVPSSKKGKRLVMKKRNAPVGALALDVLMSAIQMGTEIQGTRPERWPKNLKDKKVDEVLEKILTPPQKGGVSSYLSSLPLNTACGEMINYLKSVNAGRRYDDVLEFQGNDIETLQKPVLLYESELSLAREKLLQWGENPSIAPRAALMDAVKGKKKGLKSMKANHVEQGDGPTEFESKMIEQMLLDREIAFQVLRDRALNMATNYDTSLYRANIEKYLPGDYDDSDKKRVNRRGARNNFKKSSGDTERHEIHELQAQIAFKAKDSIDDRTASRGTLMCSDPISNMNEWEQDADLVIPDDDETSKPNSSVLYSHPRFPYSSDSARIIKLGPNRKIPSSIGGGGGLSNRHLNGEVYAIPNQSGSNIIRCPYYLTADIQDLDTSDMCPVMGRILYPNISAASTLYPYLTILHRCDEGGWEKNGEMEVPTNFLTDNAVYKEIHNPEHTMPLFSTKEPLLTESMHYLLKTLLIPAHCNEMISLKSAVEEVKKNLNKKDITLSNPALFGTTPFEKRFLELQSNAPAIIAPVLQHAAVLFSPPLPFCSLSNSGKQHQNGVSFEAIMNRTNRTARSLGFESFPFNEAFGIESIDCNEDNNELSPITRTNFVHFENCKRKIRRKHVLSTNIFFSSDVDTREPCRIVLDPKRSPVHVIESVKESFAAAAMMARISEEHAEKYPAAPEDLIINPNSSESPVADDVESKQDGRINITPPPVGVDDPQNCVTAVFGDVSKTISSGSVVRLPMPQSYIDAKMRERFLHRYPAIYHQVSEELKKRNVYPEASSASENAPPVQYQLSQIALKILHNDDINDIINEFLVMVMPGTVFHRKAWRLKYEPSSAGCGKDPYGAQFVGANEESWLENEKQIMKKNELEIRAAVDENFGISQCRHLALPLDLLLGDDNYQQYDPSTGSFQKQFTYFVRGRKEDYINILRKEGIPTSTSERNERDASNYGSTDHIVKSALGHVINSLKSDEHHSHLNSIVQWDPLFVSPNFTVGTLTEKSRLNFLEDSDMKVSLFNDSFLRNHLKETSDMTVDDLIDMSTEMEPLLLDKYGFARVSAAAHQQINMKGSNMSCEGGRKDKFILCLPCTTLISLPRTAKVRPFLGQYVGENNIPIDIVHLERLAPSTESMSSAGVLLDHDFDCTDWPESCGDEKERITSQGVSWGDFRAALYHNFSRFTGTSTRSTAIAQSEGKGGELVKRYDNIRCRAFFSSVTTKSDNKYTEASQQNGDKQGIITNNSAVVPYPIHSIKYWEDSQPSPQATDDGSVPCFKSVSESSYYPNTLTSQPPCAGPYLPHHNQVITSRLSKLWHQLCVFPTVPSSCPGDVEAFLKDRFERYWKHTISKQYDINKCQVSHDVAFEDGEIARNIPSCVLNDTNDEDYMEQMDMYNHCEEEGQESHPADKRGDEMIVSEDDMILPASIVVATHNYAKVRLNELLNERFDEWCILNNHKMSESDEVDLVEEKKMKQQFLQELINGGQRPIALYDKLLPVEEVEVLLKPKSKQDDENNTTHGTTKPDKTGSVHKRVNECQGKERGHIAITDDECPFFSIKPFYYNTWEPQVGELVAIRRNDDIVGTEHYSISDETHEVFDWLGVVDKCDTSTKLASVTWYPQGHNTAALIQRRGQLHITGRIIQLNQNSTFRVLWEDGCVEDVWRAEVKAIRSNLDAFDTDDESEFTEVFINQLDVGGLVDELTEDTPTPGSSESGEEPPNTGQGIVSNLMGNIAPTSLIESVFSAFMGAIRRGMETNDESDVNEISETPVVDNIDKDKESTTSDCSEVLPEDPTSQQPSTGNTFTICATMGHHLLSSNIDVGVANNPRLFAKRVHAEWKLMQNNFIEKSDSLMSMDTASRIIVKVSEDNINMLKFAITGPLHTPYYQSLLCFDMALPKGFPVSPPLCLFHSYNYRLNPNLYENGKICLSLLGTWESQDSSESWNAAQSSVYQVIASIQALVLVKEPYYNEAGYDTYRGTKQGKIQSRHYNEMIVLNRIDHLISMAEQPPSDWVFEFRDHYRCMVPKILQRLNRLVERYDAGEFAEGGESTGGKITADGIVLPMSKGLIAGLNLQLKALSNQYKALIPKWAAEEAAMGLGPDDAV